jgi:hypothetical protein
MSTNKSKPNYLAKLPLPNGTLIINYDVPAQAYFNYELTPRSTLSKLAFLGAITEIQINGKEGNHPTTGDTLQEAGIGRKNLGGNGDTQGLIPCVLACEFERFTILDGATNILKSRKLLFDNNINITFEDSNSDIYQDTVWGKEISDLGRIQAHINDVSRYCKINGKPLTDDSYNLPVSQGGIGWLLAAFLLQMSIEQGKFEFTIPIPL